MAAELPIFRCDEILSHLYLCNLYRQQRISDSRHCFDIIIVRCRWIIPLGKSECSDRSILHKKLSYRRETARERLPF